jgi:hypothetical protein
MAFTCSQQRQKTKKNWKATDMEDAKHCSTKYSRLPAIESTKEFPSTLKNHAQRERRLVPKFQIMF